MNKTLYAFGDSFTNYFWPMWPEILGQSFQQVKNFGESGCGNYRIFQQFNELFSNVDNPTVIVQWTDPCRFDSFDRNYNWFNLGEESAEVFYKNKKLYHLNAEELTVCKQLSYMVSIANFLQLLGIDWYYIFLNKASCVHTYNVIKDNNSVSHTIFNLQYKLLQFKNRIIDTEDLTSHMEKINMPKKFSSFNGQIAFADGHPTPIFTYSFIKEHLLQNIENLNNDKMFEYSQKSENIIQSTKIKDTLFLNKSHQKQLEKY